MHRLLPLAWVRGPGTSRVRPGAVFASGDHKLLSRRETYSAKVVLAMPYIRRRADKKTEAAVWSLLCSFRALMTEKFQRHPKDPFGRD